ncbi:hypothetical protein [Methylocella sp.]|uniref:hypothetical protein n=1 Tax=Methylocella sp. TaxID=1978226 RepID=UPI003784B4C0
MTRPGTGARAVAATLLLLGALFAAAAPARAQTAPSPADQVAPAVLPPLNFPGPTSHDAPAEPPAAGSILHLTAVLSAADPKPLRSGVRWRVFSEKSELDGTNRLVAESSDAIAALTLPDGSYIIHAAFGLAGATKRVTVAGRGVSERIVLNAGALKVTPLVGDVVLPAAKTQIAVFVPEKNNSEAKLVATIKSGQTIGLPEGDYHVVSTMLDPQANGSSATTNSVVNADLRVQAGKLIDASLRHRAATMTLKLVSGPSGEALANTSFTILTPGGDVIREMIGAFPSIVLAEGEYVAIARHDDNVFQTNFKVESAIDRDVEVMAK